MGVVTLEMGKLPIILTAEQGWVPNGMEVALIEFKRINL
jgi:hypothetical protein